MLGGELTCKATTEKLALLQRHIFFNMHMDSPADGRKQNSATVRGSTGSCTTFQSNPTAVKSA